MPGLPMSVRSLVRWGSPQSKLAGSLLINVVGSQIMGAEGDG